MKSPIPRGKPRDFVSIKGAVARCATVLKNDLISQVTGKSWQLVRLYSDPDADRHISVRDALLLDKAMRQAGHGSPIHEVYAALLSETPSAIAGRCLREAFMDVAARVSPVAVVITEALEDGTVDQRERREIELAVHGLIDQCRALLGALEPPQRMELAAD